MTISLDDFKRAVPVLEPGTTQNVAYTDTAGAISNAITTQVVRVWTTTDAFVTFGAAPTADTSDMPVSAGVAEYFKVPSPGTSKLLAVRVSASGTVYVTEMAVN